MRQRANSLVIALLALASLIGFTSAIGADDIAGVTAGRPNGPVPGEGVGPSVSTLAPDQDDAQTSDSGPVSSADNHETSVSESSDGGANAEDATSRTTDGQGPAGTVPEDLPPLKVAYLVPDTTGATAFGFAGPVESDGMAEDREFRALFDWVNTTGGIGGRPIEARAFRITAAEKIDENRLVQRCVEIAEDFGASYVIDTQIMGFPSTQQCFAQRGVVLVSWAFGLTEELQGQLVPHVATTAPTIDQMFAALVPQLQAIDYLRGAEVGVFLNDDPFLDGPYEQILEPALERAGTPPAAVARAGDFDQAAITNALLAFQSARVTHVIFVGHIFQITAFANSAEVQGYRPRYAFPDYFTANRSAPSAPSAQVRGAVAVSAFYDVVTEDASRHVDDFSSPFDRDAVAPGLRRCLDTLSEARQTDYYRPGQAGTSSAFTEICDHFLLWLDAVTAAGYNLDPASFAAGLRALGTRYPSPRIYATGFGDGRQVGATHFAAGIYNEACACYPRGTPWSSP